MKEISEILTHNVKELPVKLSKDDLREYTNYEHRFNLAKLTHKISVYTDGILTLDKTLMGLIELDPKEILVDGIRNELVKTVATILHETFIFKNSGNKDDLYQSFYSLKSKFSGMKKAFEYIQDFLNIQGEAIWGEEINRIFKKNLDQEAILLINKKYDY